MARKKRSWRSGYKNDPRQAPAVASTAASASASVDDDVDLSDEDFGILDAFGAQNIAFLHELNPRDLSATQAAAKGPQLPRARGLVAVAHSDDDSDEEASYERAPRNAPSADQDFRLPIKTSAGMLVRLPKAAPTPASDEEKDFQSGDEQKDDIPDTCDSVNSSSDEESVAETLPSAPSSDRLAEAREQLAVLATAVLEDPETNISHLRTMRSWADGAGSKDDRIAKLALLTQLAVFKDIIPGYRIRKLTEKELAVQVSKDVKRLRNFEEGLLTHYQAYLVQLEKRLSAAIGSKYKQGQVVPIVRETLAGISLVCLCDLIKSVSHFNFRLNIMTAVTSILSRLKHPDMIEMCAEAFERLFRDDLSGEASRDAVRLISKSIKNAHFRIPPRILRTFLVLRLAEEFDPSSLTESGSDETKSKKRKGKHEPHMSKKMRKLAKERAEVEKEMKEAEAVVDSEERQKNHSDTLKNVFVIYFRILKEAHDAQLVVCALEGVGRFSHLISVDFFTDLLAVIRSICTKEDSFSNCRRLIRLRCVVSILELLASIKDALKVDLLQFHSVAYVDLLGSWRVGFGEKNQEEQELMLQAMDLIFRRFKELPIERSAAFAKRLATVSASCSEGTAVGMLSILHRNLMRLPKLGSLVDSDGTSGGVYDAFVSDMDLCNPLATSLWELSTLRNHFHPSVRSCAEAVLADNDQKLAFETQKLLRSPASQLVRKLDCFGSGSFCLRPQIRRIDQKKNPPAVVRGPCVISESEFMKELQLKMK